MVPSVQVMTHQPSFFSFFFLWCKPSIKALMIWTFFLTNTFLMSVEHCLWSCYGPKKCMEAKLKWYWFELFYNQIMILTSFFSKILHILGQWPHQYFGCLCRVRWHIIMYKLPALPRCVTKLIGNTAGLAEVTRPSRFSSLGWSPIISYQMVAVGLECQENCKVTSYFYCLSVKRNLNWNSAKLTLSNILTQIRHDCLFLT